MKLSKYRQERGRYGVPRKSIRFPVITPVDTACTGRLLASWSRYGIFVRVIHARGFARRCSLDADSSLLKSFEQHSLRCQALSWPVQRSGTSTRSGGWPVGVCRVVHFRIVTVSIFNMSTCSLSLSLSLFPPPKKSSRLVFCCALHL